MFFVPPFPRVYACRETSRHLRHFRVASEKWFMHPDPGVLPDNGGRTNRGRKTPGIWKLFFPTNLQPRAACIVFVMTGCRKNGSCGECTTDVRRAACPLCFQFSRRRSHAGRIGEHLLSARYVFHGAARSRWPLWRTAILSGRTKNRNSRAYRRGSHVRAGLALSTAGHFFRGIQKPLPPDYADETSCRKRRRRC